MFLVPLLQDKSFEHVKSKDFDLEKVEKSDRAHIEITEFKKQTLQKELQEIESTNIGLKIYMDVIVLNEEIKKKVKSLEIQLERIFSVIKMF